MNYLGFSLGQTSKSGGSRKFHYAINRDYFYVSRNGLLTSGSQNINSCLFRTIKAVKDAIKLHRKLQRPDRFTVKKDPFGYTVFRVKANGEKWPLAPFHLKADAAHFASECKQGKVGGL